MKSVIIVCKHGVVRSPWIRDYLTEALEKRKLIDVTVKSVGICPFRPEKQKPLSEKMVEQADLIFAMDNKVYKTLVEIYPSLLKKIINVDILDVYNEFGGFDERMLGFYRSSDEEKREVQNRHEIYYELSLKEVFERKKELFLGPISKLVSDKKFLKRKKWRYKRPCWETDLQGGGKKK